MAEAQAPREGTDEKPRWTISIVSHGHADNVLRPIRDIGRQLAGVAHQFVLTLNAGEDPGFLSALPEAQRQRVRVIANREAKGYGANHNAALADCTSDYVLVADPDLSLRMPIFDALQQQLDDPACGIVAPLAETPDGAIEDNGRALVTPTGLMRRYLLGERWRRNPHPGETVVEVDWLAGLFMAMRSDTFHRLGGFDTRYFLYCEDVDLCLRASAHGLAIRLLGDLRVTHAPNRSTLRKSQHFIWHLQSLLRLWRTESYRQARRTRAR